MNVQKCKPLWYMHTGTYALDEHTGTYTTFIMFYNVHTGTYAGRTQLCNQYIYRNLLVRGGIYLVPQGVDMN